MSNSGFIDCMCVKPLRSTGWCHSPSSHSSLHVSGPAFPSSAMAVTMTSAMEDWSSFSCSTPKNLGACRHAAVIQRESNTILRALKWSEDSLRRLAIEREAQKQLRERQAREREAQKQLRELQDWRSVLAQLADMIKFGPEPDSMDMDIVTAKMDRAGQWRRACQVFEERRWHGINPIRNSYTSASSACSRAAQWMESLELLTEFSTQRFSKDEICFNLAITTHQRASRWPFSLELLQEMSQTERLEPNGNSYGSAFTAVGYGGQGHNWARVLAMLDSLLKKNIEPGRVARQHAARSLQQGSRDTQIDHTVAINELGKEQRWQEALDLFAGLGQQQFQADLQTWSAVVDACQRGGSWTQTIALLDAMQTARVMPNAATLTCVATACGEVGEWEKALHLLWQTIGGGSLNEDSKGAVAADTRFLASVLTACERSSQWQWALHLLHQCPQPIDAQGRNIRVPSLHLFSKRYEAAETRKGRILPSTSDRVRWPGDLRADTYCYNAVISACGSAGQWERALSLLDEMDSPLSPDVVSYNSAITACDRGEQWQRALWLLFAEMPARSIAPNEVSFSAAVSACAQAGFVKRALRAKEKMRSQKLVPSVFLYSHLIAACEREDRWSLAKGLLHEMRKEKVQPNIVVYNHAIGACMAGNAPEEVEVILQEMQSDSVTPDVVTFGNLIKGSRNNWVLALHYLSEMKKLDLQMPNVVSFSDTINACRKCERWQEALQLHEEMLESKLQPDVVSYGTIIDACSSASANLPGATDDAQVRNWARSLRLFDEMRLKGIPENDVVCRSAMRGCANGRCWESVLVLSEEMFSQLGLEHDAVSANIQLTALAGSRKWELAAKCIDTHIQKHNFKPDEITYAALHSSPLTPTKGSADQTGTTEKSHDVQDDIAEQKLDGLAEEFSNVLLEKAGRNRREAFDGGHVLDLHSLPLATARATVLKALSERSSDRSLLILTGRGRHSNAETGPLLKPALISFVQDELHLEVVEHKNGGAFYLPRRQIAKFRKAFGSHFSREFER
eukprot:TRINITY_DN4658_c2_g1_i1.p1 TRINITY_DN4658_c2_g1~~TRINITY_DN4658_c2_g1_i1.p1  ORF type:complete len:1023 (-),score=170.74 TRINITY_DN4658_c2_g1_i1:206-3274(-)